MNKTGIHEKNVGGRIGRPIQAVIQGMLFLGFTFQIILGAAWMCCNFMQGQNFSWHNLGRTESGEGIFALCRSLYEFLGRWPAVVYLLQLVLAFFAGYVILMKYAGRKISEDRGRQRAFAVWGSLALLTFPFAMQCHLAVLPYSAMASLFLLMLSFLLELAGGKKEADAYENKGTEKQSAKEKATGSHRAGKWKFCMSAIVCGTLAIILSGSVNADEREGIWGRGVQAALASRIAWPNIWNDYGYWSEDLQEITEDVVWEASYYPGNMELILQAIEDAAGPEQAKDYYLQIAQIGWEYRAYMTVRQIGWDILGYGATPLIFRLQLDGEAYDSYTGRNYEIMQEHTPALTRYYVDYGCWWFGRSLVLAALWAVARALQGGVSRESRRKWLVSAVICIVAAGIPVVLYTMRGAGMMDYRCTVGINELWLIPGLACAGCGTQESRSHKEYSGKSMSD